MSGTVETLYLRAHPAERDCPAVPMHRATSDAFAALAIRAARTAKMAGSSNGAVSTVVFLVAFDIRRVLERRRSRQFGGITQAVKPSDHTRPSCRIITLSGADVSRSGRRVHASRDKLERIEALLTGIQGRGSSNLS